MTSSNPLKPIYDAFLVSSACFKVAQRAVKAQQDVVKAAQGRLLNGTLFLAANPSDAENAIKDAEKRAEDLVVLALFATFERFVIEQLQSARQWLQGGYPTEYAKQLAAKFEDAVERWQFGEILDLFSVEIEKDLLGQAKSIKKYRDWIAHRNPKSGTPMQAVPRQTYEVLTKIIEEIQIKHAPAAPPPADAVARPPDAY